MDSSSEVGPSWSHFIYECIGIHFFAGFRVLKNLPLLLKVKTNLQIIIPSPAFSFGCVRLGTIIYVFVWSQ